MADGPKLHNVVVDTFKAVRTAATEMGLSMTSFRDFEHVLFMMEKDDKHLDSLEKLTIPLGDEGDSFVRFMTDAQELARVKRDAGEDIVACKAEIYTLVDHAIGEIYGCESQDVSPSQCSK